jgi:hypothetical protein
LFDRKIGDRYIKTSLMSDIYEFDRNPNLYRERAGKLRDWAAETSDEKVRAELYRLAGEYERLAESELKREPRAILTFRAERRPLRFVDDARD